MCEKTCSVCLELLPLEAFTSRHKRCRACHAAKARADRAADPERYRASVAKWAAKNKERRLNYDRERYAAQRLENIARVRAWQEKNPDMKRAATLRYREKPDAKLRDARLRKEWSEANPGKVTAYAMERHAAKLGRRLRSSKEAVLAVYERAALLTIVTGVPHHVDHEVPLKGKNVCGLHVPWNLRCIPAEENRAKHNKFEACA